VESFRATVGPLLADAAVPPGLFWCLAPEIVSQADLGADGHPRRGLFLPPVPLPRRMWAGGELAFHGTFAVGETVTKTSTIEDIAEKSGRSGTLCFVTVRHAYSVDGALVLDERQDIVYRAPPSHEAEPPPAAAPPSATATVRAVETTPTQLFRYSALTFNGHRIHYDADYARTVEGYDGLVVHGPLQATWMLNLSAARLGRLPARFAYRGRAPLLCARPARAQVADDGAGRLAATVVADGGPVTASAVATP
jgi:3-methylfumaryl-CoA hydratase